QVTSFVILLITLGAVVYMMFGNRFLDQFFHRIRMTVKGNKSLRLEQIPNTLAIDRKVFLKYMERIVNLPARDIELQIIWSASLQYSITGAPVFSLDTIFLTAENNLIAFDKKSRKLKWKKSFDAPISSVLYMDNALMVCLQSDSASAFSEDGKLLWEADMTCPAQASVNLNPLRISGEDDPRLDRPILMIPSREVISIIDAGRGESLSSITFVDDIAAISAYDNFANCFYAIVDDALICIQLKIVN
ncbi:MAG TPA: PQQ-binding-like beta-propeller repeat protein, partial [Candidatus Cloacimonadota bacterium]|nr:PQQ-binding-like beta-propeller repeat protein [Candidatus Cloacimonadota bacterium]